MVAPGDALIASRRAPPRSRRPSPFEPTPLALRAADFAFVFRRRERRCGFGSGGPSMQAAHENISLWASAMIMSAASAAVGSSRAETTEFGNGMAMPLMITTVFGHPKALPLCFPPCRPAK
jgi:hypothetical protein